MPAVVSPLPFSDFSPFWGQSLTSESVPAISLDFGPLWFFNKHPFNFFRAEVFLWISQKALLDTYTIHTSSPATFRPAVPHVLQERWSDPSAQLSSETADYHVGQWSIIHVAVSFAHPVKIMMCNICVATAMMTDIAVLVYMSKAPNSFGVVWKSLPAHHINNE